MTNGSIPFHNNMNPNSLKKFKTYILKQLKFLTECSKHIETYEKDHKGYLLHPIY